MKTPQELAKENSDELGLDDTEGAVYREGFVTGYDRAVRDYDRAARSMVKLHNDEMIKLKDALEYQREKVTELEKDDELLRNQIDYMMNGKEVCNEGARITILAKDALIQQLKNKIMAVAAEQAEMSRNK